MGSKSNKPFSKLRDLSKQDNIVLKGNDMKKLTGGTFNKGNMDDTKYNPCGGNVPVPQ